MYPDEGLQYIESRNHWLSYSENFWFQNNVAVNHKHYDSFSGITEMWDCYGNHYWYHTYQDIIEDVKIKVLEKGERKCT